MKHIKLLILYLLATSTSYASLYSNYKMDYSRIKPGEKYFYTAHWGILTIGSASIVVDSRIYKIDNVPCMKIDVQGRTNGLAKLFYVRDQWTSYVDTSKIFTHKSTRSIREGSYKLDEIVDFDHNKQKAYVKVFNKTLKEFQLKKIYDTPENTRDVIAGFMVVRMINLENFKTGDYFSINGFYEDEGYRMNIQYAGKETIKVNNKQISCHKIRPVLPKNKVFDGQNSVEVWLSNDDKQHIVRVKARMFAGNIIINQIEEKDFKK